MANQKKVGKKKASKTSSIEYVGCEIQYQAMKLVSSNMSFPLRMVEGELLLQSNSTKLVPSKDFFVIRTGFNVFKQVPGSTDRTDALSLLVDHAFLINLQSEAGSVPVVSDPEVELKFDRQVLANIFATAHSSMRGVVMMTVRGTWLDHVIQNPLTLETILGFDPELLNGMDPFDLRQWMT